MLRPGERDKVIGLLVLLALAPALIGTHNFWTSS